ncbi:MAG: hypothetical protein Q8M16_19975 [Pirellulaceae bacterium]|nr:hypothetical protein [Pirellulaceae bacterium]
MQRLTGWAWCLVFLMSICLWGATTPSWAQPPGRAESPRDAVDSAFNRKSPEVGDTVPNLAAYRADGSTVRLHDLKGKHTVLVFGCLT